MKILFIIITLLITASCGKQAKIKKRGFSIDSKARPFYDTFNEKSMQLSLDRSNIVIKFGNLAPGILGVCEIESYIQKPNMMKLQFDEKEFIEVPTITLNSNYWNYLSNSEKEELVYHELGHCVMNKNHEEGTVTTGSNSVSGAIPKSIMNPYSFSGNIYTSYYGMYLKSLFGYAKTNSFNESQYPQSSVDESQRPKDFNFKEMLHNCKGVSTEHLGDEEISEEELSERNKVD